MRIKGPHVNKNKDSPPTPARYRQRARAVDAHLQQRLRIPKRQDHPRASDAELSAPARSVDPEHPGDLASRIAQRRAVVEHEVHGVKPRV